MYIKSKSPSVVLHCIVDVNILLLEKNQICIYKRFMLLILKKGCTSLMFQSKLQYFHIVNLILYVLGIKGPTT